MYCMNPLIQFASSYTIYRSNLTKRSNPVIVWHRKISLLVVMSSFHHTENFKQLIFAQLHVVTLVDDCAGPSWKLDRLSRIWLPPSKLMVTKLCKCSYKRGGLNNWFFGCLLPPGILAPSSCCLFICLSTVLLFAHCITVFLLQAAAISICFFLVSSSLWSKLVLPFFTWDYDRTRVNFYISNKT